MGAENGQRPAIQSVVRALSALSAFTVERPELTVGEFSRRLGVHKSTASRLLATLEAAGFVRQEEPGGRYALGLRLLEVAGVLLATLELRQVAGPALARLAQATRETVNLAVWEDGEAVNVLQVPSPQPIQYVGWVGRRTPAHASATGKALLAFQPNDVVEVLLAEAPRRYTARTLVEPAPLRLELERVRAHGYAEAVEEFQEGLSAVAAPVCDADGRVCAVISVSAPTYRTPSERLTEHARLACQAADEVSRLLGWTSSKFQVPGSKFEGDERLAAGMARR
jgi:DNA-binding IclR family transcriptional regulator